MEKIVTSNLFELVNRLELKNGRRYSYTDLGNGLGITRQGVKRMLKPSYNLDNKVIAKWLAFFEREGMPVTVADLFVMVDNNESEL